MGKTDAVLAAFPSLYGANDRSKLLVRVVRALAAPLEEADSHLFRIQRAHRLLVATHPDDVVRLAAALDLSEFHFEDLVADAGLEHELRLALMRERVQRIARLHLLGLGTPWAVLEGAAIFLDAAIVPDAEGDPLVRRLDADGFSHRATIEFARAPGRPRERIVLHENPYRRNKVGLAERWPGDSWTVENRNVDVSPVRLAVQGVGERTVLPTVFCPDVQAGIVFNGVVPAGSTLLIDEDGGARIDDRPFDDFLLTFRGSTFDHMRFAAAPAFALEEGGTEEPFAGELDEVGESYRRPAELPRPPLGRSTWYFSVGRGVYDGRDFDFAVYDPIAEPVGRWDEDFAFDGCVYDLDASGVVGMAWDERIPCSLKLLLPSHVPAAAERAEPSPAPPDYAGRIAAILPRFRAAGVRAFVETAPDTWILGQGLIRSKAATDGEGIDFHTLRLHDPSAEVRVSFDPGTAT
jgi:hypothetical protein